MSNDLQHPIVKLYDIKNYDTGKKACRWLDKPKVPCRCHNYRSDDLNADLLQFFIDQFGWNQLPSNRGTTWHKLSEFQSAANDSTTIGTLALMIRQSVIVKLPLLEANDNCLLMWCSPQAYNNLIASEV